MNKLRFMTLMQLEREAKEIGCTYEETLEMAYENAVDYIKQLQRAISKNQKIKIARTPISKENIK